MKKPKKATEVATKSAPAPKAKAVPPVNRGGLQTELPNKSALGVIELLANLDEVDEKKILVSDLFNGMLVSGWMKNAYVAGIGTEESVRCPDFSLSAGAWAEIIRECPLLGLLLDKYENEPERRAEACRILQELVGTTIERQGENGELYIQLVSEDTFEGNMPYFFDVKCW